MSPKSTGDFCVSRDFFGGRGIARPPSSSPSVCASTLSPCFSEEEGSAHSSKFRRVLRRGRDRPSPSQRRCVRRLLVGRAVQVVRGQDRAGLLTVGTLRRCHPSGSEWGSCTDGALRRHHGLWDVLCLAHGCRSVPFGTLCDTMRWVCWLFVDRPGWSAGGRDAFGDTIRLGRCAPGVVLDFTCLREASGDSLLAFGLLMVWV